MAYYDDDQKIQQIQSQLDIVELISESVQLSRKGNNYWGLCPFHGEKTPSFSVSRDKQMFYCFGCHTGGNIFTFLMKRDGLEFREALEMLAAKAGVDISRPRDRSRVDHQKSIININNTAAQFYHQKLLSASGSDARSYLSQRGISEQTMDRYRLGYAGDDWQELTNYLLGRGFSPEALKASGLAKRSDNQSRFYDLFRHRIMFPIMLYNQDVIGFGGRSLGDAQPKYLNTPETEIFSKRKNLYGLAQAREAIRQNNNAFLVEGYMDCIKLQQTGIMNVVASLGTALTEEHARLLHRYAEKVTIVYDGDEAGQNATLRAADVLRGAEIKVEVISLPPGQDPDDLIGSLGKEGFWHYIENNVCGDIEFKLNRLIRTAPALDLEAKIRIINVLKEDIERLSSVVEQDAYIKMLARKLKMEENLIYQEYRRGYKREISGRYKNNNGINRDNIKYGKYGLQEKILAAMLKDPELYDKIKSRIGINFFADDKYQDFIREYDRLEGNRDEKLNRMISAHPSDNTVSTYARVAMLIGEEDTDLDIELEEFIMRVEKKKNESQWQRIYDQVEKLADQGDFQSIIRFMVNIDKAAHFGREGGSL
ncbi:MAG: DNA primase [Syntrophomonadaceae bacterium]